MEQRFRWMAGLGILLLAIAVGTVAYNVGVSHGLSVAAPAAGAPAPGSPVYYYNGYRHWGWGFGFFPLGIILWIFALRFLFWGACGPRWWHYRYGRYGPYDDPSGRFEEWHRRAHERMNNQPQG
jgi:hypothetical protein